MSRGHINEESLETGFNMVLSLRWEYDDALQETYLTYFDAYLSKSAVWAKRFQVKDRFPFINFAECLYTLEESELMRNYFRQMDDYFENFYYLSVMVKATCYWYLDWTGLVSNNKIALLNLPNPFEPLMLLYQKGGHFRVENRFVWLGTTGIPINDISRFVSRE